MNDFNISYNPLDEEIERFLGGPLEAAVMRGIWASLGDDNYVGINEVHQHVVEHYKEVRYTTVARVLDTLYKKGMLERGEGEVSGHKCLIFIPKLKTQREFEFSVVGHLLSYLLEQYRPQFISWIVYNLDEFADVKTDGNMPKPGRGHRNIEAMRKRGK